MKAAQNTSKNDDDGSPASRQRHKNTWESRSRFQGGETGKLWGRRGRGREGGGRKGWIIYLVFIELALFRLS